MQRALVGPSTCPSVRERILSAFCSSPSTSGRCATCACGLTAGRPRRHSERVPVPAAKGGKSAGSQGFKGFGEPPRAPKKSERSMAFDPEEEQELSAAAAQMGGDDEEEIKLLPSYQMYTDAGYKAPRFAAPLKIDQPDDEPLPVLCATQAMLPGELALVTPALGMAEGDFQQVPELEDLHALLLEEGPSPAQRRVLTLLESLRPGPTSPSTPSPSASASSSSSASSSTTAATVSAASPQQPQPQPPSPLPALATLDPKFWSGRGRDTAAPSFDARRLMRLLSRTAIADVSQDPGSMQARHQKPVGFVALWPEAALMAHSCIPNTSQLVVADRMFTHLTEEVQPGQPLTRNLIGAAVTAPLSVRQAAVAEALAEQGVKVAATSPPASSPSPAAGEEESEEERQRRLLPACRCPRCQLESLVSEPLRDTLEDAHAWYVNDAAEAWNRANESEDLALLRGLLEECETIVAEVEEAVQSEPGLDDEQQDWLRASAYDVYDMYVTLDELINQQEADPNMLRVCVELLRVHSPGSDNHVMAALKHEGVRRHRFEVFSEMLKREAPRGARNKSITKSDRRKLEALKDAADFSSELRLEAFVLRYGLVTERVLGQLTEGMETYVEGVEQLSLMRAQGMTELTREMEVEGVKVQIVDRLEVSDAARVGAGEGGARVVSKDGVQLMVVEDAPRDGEDGRGAAVRAALPAAAGLAAAVGGAGAEEEDVEEEGAVWEAISGDFEGEGEVIDLEVPEGEDGDLDLDLDAAVKAALEAALAAEDAATGEEESEEGSAPPPAAAAGRR